MYEVIPSYKQNNINNDKYYELKIVNIDGCKLKHTEPSSGYSSRNSLYELNIPMHEGISSSSENQSNCSCGKTNSTRSIITQRYISPVEQNNVHKKSLAKHSGSSTNSCCNQHDALICMNEQLLLQKRVLEEQNQNLLEELQVSRRFYQGSLAELSAQLSRASNRIQYLTEAVNTQKEALADRKKLQEPLNYGPSSPPIVPLTNSTFHQHSNKNTLSGSLSRINSALNETPRSTGSRAASVVSDNSSRSRISSLQGRDFAKIKEHLLEKNQNLKTDIELLKFKTDLPRSLSVSAPSSPRSAQELPLIRNTASQIKQHDENDRSTSTTSNDESTAHTHHKKKPKNRLK